MGKSSYVYYDTISNTFLHDIKSRIGMAKQKMVQLNNIWKDRGIPLVLKIKLLKCFIWPVVMYDFEAWSLQKQEPDKLKAAAEI